MNDEPALRDAQDERPTEPGWYPTVVCYDRDEGAFPDAHYWDGKDWLDVRGLIQWWPETKATQEEAIAFAEAKNFGW